MQRTSSRRQPERRRDDGERFALQTSILPRKPAPYFARRNNPDHPQQSCRDAASVSSSAGHAAISEPEGASRCPGTSSTAEWADLTRYGSGPGQGQALAFGDPGDLPLALAGTSQPPPIWPPPPRRASAQNGISAASQNGSTPQAPTANIKRYSPIWGVAYDVHLGYAPRCHIRLDGHFNPPGAPSSPSGPPVMASRSGAA
jgi:hypothetical protein